MSRGTQRSVPRGETVESRSDGPRPARAETTPASSAAEAAYAALVRTFEGDPRITLPTGSRGKFGANGLKIDGKIFAMSMRGALVVKLPRIEIDAAVSEGRGERLSMGAGRIMKEWLVVREHEREWPAIARRARDFVAGDR